MVDTLVMVVVLFLVPGGPLVAAKPVADYQCTPRLALEYAQEQLKIHKKDPVTSVGWGCYAVDGNDLLPATLKFLRTATLKWPDADDVTPNDFFSAILPQTESSPSAPKPPTGEILPPPPGVRP